MTKARHRKGKKCGPTPRSRPPEPNRRATRFGLAWLVAAPLASLGLVALLTDWVDWSWWIVVALFLPAGGLFLLDPDLVFDFLESDDGGGDFGGDAGGWGGDGGGGDGGGG